MQGILTASICEIAQNIREQKWTSSEVVQAFVERMKIINPKINAIVFPLFGEAIELAKVRDEELTNGIIRGELHGVPLTIKECLDLIGTPSTFGLKRRAKDFPKKNDPYVQKLLDEGAIILGKTNVSQLVAYLESDNPLYGRTKNPLHPDFTCGGSSGGEGAIISAFGSPAGLGTDSGGSVRIPAAFCGIMALKPTMQRNYDFSRFLDDKEFIFDNISSVTGILGRHVEDLDVLGRIIGSIPNPMIRAVQDFPDYKKINEHEIRVGYYLSDGLFDSSKMIQDGILKAVGVLESQGIMCKEIKPFQPKTAEYLHTRIFSFNQSELFLNNLKKDTPAKQIAALVFLMKMPPFLIHSLGKILGLFGQENLKRLSQHFGGKGREEWQKLIQERKKYVNYCLDKMKYERINVILSPVNALPGYLHDSSSDLGSAGTYTLVHNVTGFPAGVLTIGNIKKENIAPRKKTIEHSIRVAHKIEKQSEGLPISVQVAAPHWQEDLVLKVMDVLKKNIN